MQNVGGNKSWRKHYSGPFVWSHIKLYFNGKTLQNKEKESGKGSRLPFGCISFLFKKQRELVV